MFTTILSLSKKPNPWIPSLPLTPQTNICFWAITTINVIVQKYEEKIHTKLPGPEIQTSQAFSPHKSLHFQATGATISHSNPKLKLATNVKKSKSETNSQWIIL